MFFVIVNIDENEGQVGRGIHLRGQRSAMVTFRDTVQHVPGASIGFLVNTYLVSVPAIDNS
jgi:hypothetical protein